MEDKEIPKDMIVEILVRLPVKTLILCKSVCKSWYSLISNPNFSRYHLSRQKQDSSVIVCYHPKDDRYYPKDFMIQSIGGSGYDEDDDEEEEEIFRKPVEVYLPLKQGYSLPRIKSCCDGLLCLGIQGKTLILWNPSIKEYRILPNPPCFKNYFSSENFGLGYDSSINDYKLVCIPCRYALEAWVFTLKSNLWRKIGHAMNFGVRHEGIHVSGSLYWGASERYTKRDMILCFNLEHEAFREVELPPCDYSAGESATAFRIFSPELMTETRPLGCWKGFLSFVRDYSLWVRKEEKTECGCKIRDVWTKLMTFPKYEVAMNPVFFPHLKPLCFTNSGKVFVSMKNKFALYDPKHKTYKKVSICGLEDYCETVWGDHKTVYTESLISPGEGKISYRYDKEPLFGVQDLLIFSILSINVGLFFLPYFRK